MGWYKHTTHREHEGQQIVGVYLPAIIHNGPHQFTLLGIYADSMIDCWGLQTLAEFRQKIQSRWVTNTVPDSETLYIHHFATLSVARCDPHGSMDDLYKNVCSAIEELNGRITAQDKFAFAIRAYRENRTDQNLRLLQEAHEAVPRFYYRYTLGSRFERHPETVELLRIDRRVMGAEPSDDPNSR